LKKSHEIASFKGKLSKIEEKLLNVDKEEPFNLEKEIQDLSQELTRIEYEIKDQKKLLEDELSNRSEINQKLKSINERDFKILQNRIELTKTLMDLFEGTISIYRNKRRKDVEEIATKIFKQIRSKEDYDSLLINDNFGMSVITKLGTVLDKAEWRSAGEEQIVALALIGALNKCAQIRAPIFMDTPFGRLDIEHGERVLKFIPSMSEQVVLLVTDREFRRDDEKYLKGKISSDYTLIHRGEERGSHIIQTSTVGGLT